jgi:hypothetical protein
MTNEQLRLLVAPYSEGGEFPQGIEKYRGIVEEAVFDCLGRPSFFDETVEAVMGRMAARIEEKKVEATAEVCATRAPQESGIREAVRREADRLKREIKERFVRSGKLEMAEQRTARERS